MIVFLVLFSIGLVLCIAKKEKNNWFCGDTQTDRFSMNKNAKTVLLIHGYPEPIYKDHPLYKYFVDRDYTIVDPYLFSPEFRLTKSETKKYLEEKLSGRKPDVIVGVSMGGLIAPLIAEDYPAAKLVLVATGPYVRTTIGSLNSLLRWGSTPALDAFYGVIKLIPTWVYSIIYRSFNHSSLSSINKAKLTQHIKENWACVTSIPLQEDREVADLLSSVDNTELLKRLNNKTIIFAAENDLMMPYALSLKLKELIKDSSLINTGKRIHFNIFDESNYASLDNFLKN